MLRKPNVYKEIAVSKFINVYFDVKKEINLNGQAWTKQHQILIQKKLYWVEILQKTLSYEILS